MGVNIRHILLYNPFSTPHLILERQNFRPLIPLYVPFAIQLSIEIDLLRIVNSCSFIFNFSTNLMCNFFYKLQESYFTLPLQIIATLQKMIIQQIQNHNRTSIIFKIFVSFLFCLFIIVFNYRLIHSQLRIIFGNVGVDPIHRYHITCRFYH